MNANSLSINTDLFPAGEAFDTWRHMMQTGALGISLESTPSEVEKFQGSLSLVASGGTTLAQMNVSRHLVHRSTADIVRKPSGVVGIYQQLSGGAWFEGGGNEAFVVNQGEFVIANFDAPMMTDTLAGARHDFRILLLPVALFGALGADPGRLPAQPFGATGLGALATAYFNALCREFDALHALGEAPVRALAQLAEAALGGPADAELLQGSLQEARFRLLTATIDARLANPQFDPAMAAALLRISVRQVHQLFEPTGTTFSRYVQAKRLDRARALLLRDPRPVLSVAYACGFDSMATFNRRFRERFGMTPIEWRRFASPER